MTTEDMQGQVARSAAVERELREQIGKLREELAEANRERVDLIRQRDYEWDRRKKAQAARAAAESALSEARGALREERRRTVSALATWFRNGPVRALLNTYVAGQIQRWAPKPASSGQEEGVDFDLMTDLLSKASIFDGLAMEQRITLAQAAPELIRLARLGAASPPPGEQGKGADPVGRKVADLLGRGYVANPREGEPGDAETYSAEQGKGGGEGLRPELANHLLYVHPLPWRVGRKVARNVYDAHSEGVAMFTHAYTAAVVVEAVNRLAPAQPAEHPAPLGCLGCEAEAHPEMDGAAEWVGFHEPAFCKKPHPASGGEEK